MIKTVNDLILELNKVKNKSLPIYAYYEHEEILEILSVDDRVDLNLRVRYE